MIPPWYLQQCVCDKIYWLPLAYDVLDAPFAKNGPPGAWWASRPPGFTLAHEASGARSESGFQGASMRVIGQLAVIAVLGAAGYGGWYAYKEGHLAEIPVVGPSIANLIPQPAGNPGRTPGGPGGPPSVVEVDTVKTGRIVETREAVGTVRAFESITVTAKVAGTVEKIA